MSIILRAHNKSSNKINNNLIEWEYNGWKERGWSQRDWLQTIMTKINECSAKIHRQSLNGGADTIECGSNLEEIFDALEYYDNTKDKPLGGRYTVDFRDDMQNVIKLYNSRTPNIIWFVQVIGIEPITIIKDRKYLLLV